MAGGAAATPRVRRAARHVRGSPAVARRQIREALRLDGGSAAAWLVAAAIPGGGSDGCGELGSRFRRVPDMRSLCLLRALQLEPRTAPAWCDLGSRPDAALEALRRPLLAVAAAVGVPPAASAGSGLPLWPVVARAVASLAEAAPLAAVCFERALRLEPNDAAAAVNAALAMARHRQPEARSAAAAVLREVIACAPPGPACAHVALADLVSGPDARYARVAHLETARGRPGGDTADGRNRLGLAYAAVGDPIRAAEHLAVAAARGSAAARRNLVLLCGREPVVAATGAASDEATAAAAAAAGASAADHDAALLERTGRWIAAGHLEAAAAVLEAAAERVRPPPAPGVLAQLGVVAAHRGQWPRARAYFAAASARAPTAEHLCYLGAAAREDGDREAAERAFQRALRVSPAHAEAHRNLGALYAEDGRHSDAYRVFAALPAGDAQVAAQVAHLCTQIPARRREAGLHFRRALADAAGERDWATHYNYAVYLSNQAGESEAADRHFARAAELNPRLVGALLDDEARGRRHPDGR